MRIEFVSLTLLASLTLSVCAQQAAQNSPTPVSLPPTHTKETTLRSYGPAEQIIIVQGDMSGIVIPFPINPPRSRVSSSGLAEGWTVSFP